MAKYTNQNYKELANIIATESENIQGYVEGKKLNRRLKDITYYRLRSLQHVAFKMQDVFKKDNPDFDCEEFFNDCNVGSQITREFI